MLTTKSFWFSIATIACLAVAVSAFAQAAGKDDAGSAAGNYIVVLKDNVDSPDAAAVEMSRAHNLGVAFAYKKAVKGFAASIPKNRLEKLKADPRVAFVSEDRVVMADVDLESAAKTGKVSAQAQSVPTGIARINAVAKANKGLGVTVAVIDTGVDLNHADLKANLAGSGKTCVKGTTSAKDDNGHGTHVAGTIAALENTVGVVGVAPKAKIVPVKVLDRQGRGTWSSVICGIDWVTANASSLKIKVANMSLGGAGASDNNCGLSNSDALHNAICRSRDAGLTYVVSAGNSAANSSGSVPAAYDDAVVTVSALADSNGLPGGTGPATVWGADDTFATFSNYGVVVDVGAPGVDIRSTWKNGSYATLSGTSMAAPHASGLAALYLSVNPGAIWTAVKSALVAAGEALGAGHTDPSGLHPEPVVNASAF